MPDQTFPFSSIKDCAKSSKELLQKTLRRAKELNPDNPDVYHFYGHYLELAGRFDEAIIETKRGLDFNPTSAVINAELGWAYYVARRYDPTIARTQDVGVGCDLRLRVLDRFN